MEYNRRCNVAAAYGARERRRMKNLIGNREGWQCIYCDDRLGYASATLDHVVDAARGGPWSEQNLVLSCEPCNTARRGIEADVFLFHMIWWCWPLR